MSIELSHVRKTFGGYVALSDVSLKVRDGELVVAGPGPRLRQDHLATDHCRAGSGRSRQRAHPLRQSRRGRDRRWPRGVGFVFQHYALFRH